jgi:hypothetical protein
MCHIFPEKILLIIKNTKIVAILVVLRSYLGSLIILDTKFLNKCHEQNVRLVDIALFKLIQVLKKILAKMSLLKTSDIS